MAPLKTGPSPVRENHHWTQHFLIHRLITLILKLSIPNQLLYLFILHLSMVSVPWPYFRSPEFGTMFQR